MKLLGISEFTYGFAFLYEQTQANWLTNDFWTPTLPHNLDNSSARSPELFTYIAAQNKLAAPVLFSINGKKVSDLLDPSPEDIEVTVTTYPPKHG